MGQLQSPSMPIIGTAGRVATTTTDSSVVRTNAPTHRAAYCGKPSQAKQIIRKNDRFENSCFYYCRIITFSPSYSTPNLNPSNPQTETRNLSPDEPLERAFRRLWIRPQQLARRQQRTHPCGHHIVLMLFSERRQFLPRTRQLTERKNRLLRMFALKLHLVRRLRVSNSLINSSASPTRTNEPPNRPFPL